MKQGCPGHAAHRRDLAGGQRRSANVHTIEEAPDVLVEALARNPRRVQETEGDAARFVGMSTGGAELHHHGDGDAIERQLEHPLAGCRTYNGCRLRETSRPTPG
jgi:hypothetical protein